jgi:hypothetical protein
MSLEAEAASAFAITGISSNASITTTTDATATQPQIEAKNIISWIVIRYQHIGQRHSTEDDEARDEGQTDHVGPGALSEGGDGHLWLWLMIM